MIVMQARSSSLNEYKFCEHKYFINYVLGHKLPTTRKSTDRGTIVHKVLELLAAKQLAIQEKLPSFYDKELDKSFGVDLTSDEALKESWVYYVNKVNHHDWDNDDLEICKELLGNVFKTEFSPEKRKIVAPEYYFDLPLNKDWSKFTYEIGDKIMTGDICLKGTLDLITELTPNTIEYVDWKTGRRWDWNKNIKKDYDTLRSDVQLRLYHYALYRVFGDKYRYFLITIFFIKDGGPYTVYFGPEDLEATEKYIEKTIKNIRDCYKPHLIKPSFKCNFCEFNKPQFQNSKKSYCKFFEKEISKNGIEETTRRFIKLDMVGEYSGGGKTQ